jgi:molybdopterin-dependent oxidoreductase alpha subunit
MKNLPYIGGWKSVYYSLHVAKEVGLGSFYKAITSKNTCKTCAYGMGGQKGGMVNEAGDSIEICKKSIQAQLTDLQKAIPADYFAKNSINDLLKLSPRALERLGRLDNPIYKQKGEQNYRPISWEAALEKMVSAFKKTVAERTFFYSSGRSSNEAAFVLHLFARLYGTNNVNNCSYYCHQASGVGMGGSLGTGTATVDLQDLKNTDLIFVIGANPASNHPRFVTELLHCRRRGGKVIVINPLKEPGLVKFAIPSDVRSILSTGSEIASHYLQPKIGEDVALIMGIAKYLIEYELIDTHFIENYTEGFSAFRAYVQSTIWEEIEQICGVPKAEIIAIAKVYAEAKNVVFTWAMGITHHKNGVENVEAIVNLAMLRGMLGRKNAGLLPLRGHSNVQGVGSIGVMPTLKKKIFENIENHYQIQLPTTIGWDTMACMDQAQAGNVDLAFIMGGNLYGSNPNQNFAEKALNNIPFKIFINTTLNEGHIKGIEGEVLILPVLARDEEKQKTTQESMFNYVRLSDGGLNHLKNARSETDILVDLAKKVLDNSVIDFEAFAKHETIRKAIAAIIPSYDAIGQIDTTQEEFQVAGRTFHEPHFDTDSGRAKFVIGGLGIGKLGIGELGIGELSAGLREVNGTKSFRLMTIRSEGQFNSIIYDEEDAWRGQKERNIVLMNPEDMVSHGLVENQLVTLKSKTGELAHLKIRPFDIARGCLAGYYPEMNVLVSSEVDPRSKTPAFKNTEVWILE